MSSYMLVVKLNLIISKFIRKNKKNLILLFFLKKIILFLTQQLKGESGIDLLGIPPVRIGDGEEISYEKATTAVKKAVRLNRAVQASDGHWPAENAGPMFFAPPLVKLLSLNFSSKKTKNKKTVAQFLTLNFFINFLQLIALYISGTINTVLTSEHIKELIRYIYNHQVIDLI